MEKIIMGSFFKSSSRSYRSSSSSSKSSFGENNELLEDLVIKNRPEPNQLKYDSGYQNVLEKLKT
jgi:hypothetical protein